MARAGIRAGTHIHRTLLRRVITSPLTFHTRTTLGAILNRFSLDLATVDLVMPFTVRSCYNIVLEMATVLTVIACSTALFLTVLPVLAAVYVVVQVSA